MRGPQINEDDLIFLRTLGTGASSIVKKALLVRQRGALIPRPKYVAVKRISNLNEARPPCHACMLAAVARSARLPICVRFVRDWIAEHAVRIN